DAEHDSGTDEDNAVVEIRLAELEEDLAGTAFDPRLDNIVLKSGILYKCGLLEIRPVQDYLARARWECWGQPKSLLRTCT
ncbi:hypothetical protein C8A00DRAFT_19309, partial [Chaetomidium leptoderma]